MKKKQETLQKENITKEAILYMAFGKQRDHILNNKYSLLQIYSHPH